MSGGSPLHELTADQRRLVERIGRGEQARLLVIGPSGTGKTYAATAAVSELLARVPDARVLVLAPAPSTTSWLAMLEDRLDDASRVTRITGSSVLREKASQGRWKPGVYVISRDLARREDVSASLAARDWDLVIVEEAHALFGKRAELVARLADHAGVRSLVMLGALPPKGGWVQRFSVELWRGLDTDRVREVITYERTSGEQQLYLRVREFLDSQTTNKAARDVVERAWRSSISALERVLVRVRSGLEVSQSGSGWAAQQSLFDPLVLGEHTELEHHAGEIKVWPDGFGAGAGLDELLRRISSLRVDSKLEAALAAVERRHDEGMRAPSVITTMRESAIYIAEALESRQRPAELITTDRTVETGPNLEAGQIVVATDAGLEGIELATDTLLSYDLPRSKLRMEHRWGRVDRVGREQPVTMLALHDLSSVDDLEEYLLRLHGFGID